MGGGRCSGRRDVKREDRGCESVDVGKRAFREDQR